MLIGSRAIAYWNPEFKVRSNSDWDIVGCSYENTFYRYELGIPDEDRIEWHDPYHLNNKDMIFTFETGDRVISPYGLAIMYRSHLHRDWNWDAHITKYHKFILPLLKSDLHLSDPILLERIKLTKKAYPQGNPKLNQTNEMFFDDPVVKVYDHDFLHELYAYEDRPMFEKLKRPEQFDLAWCAKDLWDELSQTQKLQCVAEETYVIATERFMVPNDWNYPTKKAFYFALKRVCTTLTSGWFRDFAIDNFPQVFELFDAKKMYLVQAHLESETTHKRYYGEE
jgi:hypothetical protein